MGFRFHKSIKLLPGVRLNISKSGFSTSIGRPGSTVNVSKRGVRGTVGIPGTGLSYSDMLLKSGELRAEHDPYSENPSNSNLGRKVLCVLLLLIFGFVAFAAVKKLAAPEVPTPHHAQSVSAELAEGPDDAVHVGSGVNCRSDPNARSKIITVLSGREPLTKLDSQAGWTRVTTADNDCWVSSDLVR